MNKNQGFTGRNYAIRVGFKARGVVDSRESGEEATYQAAE